MRRFLVVLGFLTFCGAPAAAQGPLEPPPSPDVPPAAAPPPPAVFPSLAEPVPAPQPPAPAPQPVASPQSTPAEDELLPSAPSPEPLPIDPEAQRGSSNEVLPLGAEPGDSVAADVNLSAKSGVSEKVETKLAVRQSESAPSLGGSSGLFRLSAADVGVPGELRFGVHGEYFSGDSFIIQNDRNLRMQGALSLAFTPVRFVEVFGSILGSANRNRRLCTQTATGTVCASEPGRTDPEVVKAYGDVVLGSKVAYPFSKGMSAGGELGLKFLSSVSGLSFDPGATSVWISGLGSWDMRATSGLPLAFHFNLGLFFDNSSDLQSWTNVSRASKAVSQFAYGIGRDRVRTGVGAEWTFSQVAPGLAVRPFAEYHVEFVTAEADRTFADYRPPLCKGSSASASPNAPPCRDNRDQHWLTLGVRAQLRNSFTVGAGLDIATRAVGLPYGSPLPPYNIVLGLSHPLDLGPHKIITRTVTIEKEPLKREGTIAGRVVSSGLNAPVEGAVVGIAGRTRARVATDPDGSFRTIGLPPGPIELEVSAPNFDSTSVRAQVVEGESLELTVALTPRVKKGKVSGRITDEKGVGIPAMLRFSGPQSAEAQAAEDGTFTVSLSSGSYAVRIESGQHLVREQSLSIAEGDEQSLSTTLRARPAVSRVSIKGGRILIRQPIAFKGGAQGVVIVAPSSVTVLDELVDVLMNHPEIKQVRIEAHTDNGLPPDKALAVTGNQARAIAAYLTKAGVPADRIQAVGAGARKPIVPNIGTAARARNRRVEFHVVN